MYGSRIKDKAMKIKDILTIDLNEDIKNVIDLEDVKENEIQLEIENYIVTDGLAKEYYDFTDTFTSNILETGVWISGFYGSGKSYFAKMLGYLLKNPIINGTPARERIIQRFTGIEDESLVKNSLNKLNSQNCMVILLDIAKQNTEKGLAHTLFRCFLKTLDLPENEHGFFLYSLMVSEGQTNIYEFIKDKHMGDWNDHKKQSVKYSKVVKSIYMSSDNSESDYDNQLTTIRREIDQFDASRLKEELSHFIALKKDYKIVFLFDEASEAINQNKFTLLDLEGISEAMSTLSGKVWTIAIAQEKLDDVISGQNINRAQLTKVTDRFKTKIHLEATEVDIIIRQRLLKKKENEYIKLKEYYQSKSGQITDLTLLNAAAITKTDSSDSFATYYPFYKYQFDLLQNFLFGTKGLSSTKIAARGMIITTYDILKREMQDINLYQTVTGWQIAKQAQSSPSVRLVNRYDNAERILKEKQLSISGRKLAETVNFLSEAEVVNVTLSNIVKLYSGLPDDLHKQKNEIEKALNELVESKVLIYSNNEYRITSDIEQRMLDEMKNFNVQSYHKKKLFTNALKNSFFIKSLFRISDKNQPYDFYVKTDNEDELNAPQSKFLTLKIKSIYSIMDNRSNEIEELRTKHQNDKDLLWLIPDNNKFIQIDKLLDEIERISNLEQKHSNSNSDEGQILRGFTSLKNEKENNLKDLIENSLKQGNIVYLFENLQLDNVNCQTLLLEQQRKMIQNVYHKRIESQLSDALAPSIIKEVHPKRLRDLFPSDDFKFFDIAGHFIGEHLKVSEEILSRLKSTFVDGKTLEKELGQAPTGFSFGTVISSVAALVKGERIIVKHNGNEYYSAKDEGVKAVFNTANEFRKASYKAMLKGLDSTKKKEIVDCFQDINCQEYINKIIDWNTNDFELIIAIKDLSKRFCDKIDDMRNQNKDFDTLFPSLKNDKKILLPFTEAVNDNNYTDKAEEFLQHKDAYLNAIKNIEDTEKFIRNKLSKVIQWKTFTNDVNDELQKSTKNNDLIVTFKSDFDKLYASDLIKNFTELQKTVQKIKDEYYALFQEASTKMSEKYKEIHVTIQNITDLIKSSEQSVSPQINSRLIAYSQYIQQRIKDNIDLDYEVKDKNSKFTYSEILSFIDLAKSKTEEINELKVEIEKEATQSNDVKDPAPGLNVPALIKIKLPNKKMKVKEYKNWLHTEIDKLSEANEDDNIEINI